MSSKLSYAAISAGKGAGAGKGVRVGGVGLGPGIHRRPAGTGKVRGDAQDAESEKDSDNEQDDEEESIEVTGMDPALGKFLRQRTEQQQKMMEQQQQQQKMMMEQQQQQRQMMEQQQQQQALLTQLLEAQQKSQQQQMVMMEQWMRDQHRPAPGPSMVPLPIAMSAARGSVAANAGEQVDAGVRRALFVPPVSAGLSVGDPDLGAVGTTAAPVARKKPDLEKLALFQGEMDSEKLDTWLRRLMVHCSYYGSKGGALETEQEKVSYAAAHLEGAAADWWLAIMDGKVRTMQEFVGAVNGRFRSSVDADMAAEKLFRLKQQQGQPVANYAGVVHQLLLRLPDMAVSDRIRQFTRGLLPHLAQKVREMQPDTLEKATELAIRYEGSFGLPGGQTGLGREARGPRESIR
jgi:hypothetical protein